jgi:hypothetical protein
MFNLRSSVVASLPFSAQARLELDDDMKVACPKWSHICHQRKNSGGLLRRNPFPRKSAPVRIRTSNLLIRSQMLYPVELRVLRLKTDIELSRPQAGVQYFPPPLPVLGSEPHFRPSPSLVPPQIIR